MTERIWFCKVGGEADFFENGADLPMRRAIAKAFREVTGRDPQFTFSGWGLDLTESERAVVENRAPSQCEIDHPHFYACKHCGIGPPAPPPASALETGTAPLKVHKPGCGWRGGTCSCGAPDLSNPNFSEIAEADDCVPD